MNPMTMALISGGLSFGSGMLNSRAQKKQLKRYRNRLKRAIASQKSIQGHSFGQQEALARQATDQMVGGYDAAKREASRLGRTSRQGALDRASQLEGRASQNLASRGLGSTTVGANLSRGINADTSRQLQSINEGLAGMYGDLSLGRAGAEAGGSQALAGLAGQRGNVMSDLAWNQNMLEMANGMTQPINNFGQNLMGGIQTGMGTFMGMGGGGGGMGGMGQGGFDQNAQLLQWLYSGEQGPGHEVQPGPWRSGYQFSG